MTKPLIGVTPLWDSERDSMWMLPGYFDSIMRADGNPIMLSLTDDEDELAQLVEICDGFLFTGGQDVDPLIYGETSNGTGEVSLIRDMQEMNLLDLCLETGTPVLGICRGIQFINAKLGGGLWQDLPTQFKPNAPQHIDHANHIDGHPAPGAARHDVILEPSLAKMLGADRITVNSHHHQGVKTVAPGAEILATAPDGLVEAIRIPDQPFCLAVQWHPEETDDAPSDALFAAFIEATRS
jgi:putative glutamine amidotransferase